MARWSSDGAVEAAPLEPARQAPAQRDLDDEEECRARRPAPGRCRSRRAPGPPGARCLELVGLEEQLGCRSAASNREVHLDEAAEGALEAILGPREVAHLGSRCCRCRAPPPRRRRGRTSRRSARAGVRVDDRAGGGPDLHPDDAAAEDALGHGRVETLIAAGLPAISAGVSSGCDDAVGVDLGDRPRRR